MRRHVLVLLLLLAGAGGGIQAQSERMVVVQRPGEVLGPRADDMRRQFRDVMNLYPPELSRILRLDPTLMTNTQYLAPYSALAEFLKQHPEIARYPSYFLGDVHEDFPGPPVAPEVERSRQVIRMWENVMTGLFVLILIGTVVTAFLVVTLKSFHRTPEEAADEIPATEAAAAS